MNRATSPSGRRLIGEQAHAGISPAARPAAIRAALARLADEDLTTAVHGLAALLRAEPDAAIQAWRSWRSWA